MSGRRCRWRFHGRLIDDVCLANHYGCRAWFATAVVNLDLCTRTTSTGHRVGYAANPKGTAPAEGERFLVPRISCAPAIRWAPVAGLPGVSSEILKQWRSAQRPYAYSNTFGTTAHYCNQHACSVFHDASCNQSRALTIRFVHDYLPFSSCVVYSGLLCTLPTGFCQR